MLQMYSRYENNETSQKIMVIVINLQKEEKISDQDSWSSTQLLSLEESVITSIASVRDWVTEERFLRLRDCRSPFDRNDDDDGDDDEDVGEVVERTDEAELWVRLRGSTLSFSSEDKS